MITRLRQREARARVGEIRSKADRERIQKKDSQWTFGKLAIDAQSIWWRMNLQPCSCGSAPHMFMDIVGYGTDPKDALFICACSRCGKITRPASSGRHSTFYTTRIEYEQWGTVRATRKAASNWNNGIEPHPRNPLSISWSKILERSEIIF